MIKNGVAQRVKTQQNSIYKKVQEDLAARVHQIERDSASDDDEEDDEESDFWVELFDEEMQQVFWYNKATMERQYDTPPKKLEFEYGLVGMSVRVNKLEDDGKLYKRNGSITKYHKNKYRHRIDYADGAHEWVNLKMRGHDVEICVGEGLWMVVENHEPPDLVERRRQYAERKEKRERKKEEAELEKQWKRDFDQTKQRWYKFNKETAEFLWDSPDPYEDWITYQDEATEKPYYHNAKTNEVVWTLPRVADAPGIPVGELPTSLDQLSSTLSAPSTNFDDYDLESFKHAVIIPGGFWNPDIVQASTESEPKEAVEGEGEGTQESEVGGAKGEEKKGDDDSKESKNGDKEVEEKKDDKKDEEKKKKRTVGGQLGKMLYKANRIRN
jgi:hypothetical protein